MTWCWSVVAIAAGFAHSVALCSDGTVAAWGSNGNGQLGDNTTTMQRNVPVAVNTVPGVSALFGKTVVAIAAGSGHSLALCPDGTVAAWGHNWMGELGDNTRTQRNVPVAVNSTPLAVGEHFTRVCSGSFANHTLAVVAAPATIACCPITLSSALMSNGSFSLFFTNTSGASFSVLTTTNLSVPLSHWATVGGVTEVSPGQFQFTDSQAMNGPQRFFQVRSP